MSAKSKQESSDQWLQDAIKIRREIRDHLIALPADYPTHTFIATDEFHQVAQKLLFEYYSMFEPGKLNLGGDADPGEDDEGGVEGSLWWQPLASVSIPVSGRLRSDEYADLISNGKSDRQVLVQVAPQLPMDNKTVSLGNLRELFLSDSTFQIELKAWINNDGYRTRTIREQRYVSPALIYEARLQLDRCLAKTGKVPSFKESGRPYHDWRKEFENGVYSGPDDVDLPHKNAQ